MALKFHSVRTIGFDLAYEIEYNDGTLSDKEDNQLAAWLLSFGCPVHVDMHETDLGLGICDITKMVRETVKVKVYLK